MRRWTTDNILETFSGNMFITEEETVSGNMFTTEERNILRKHERKETFSGNMFITEEETVSGNMFTTEERNILRKHERKETFSGNMFITEEINTRLTGVQMHLATDRQMGFAVTFPVHAAFPILVDRKVETIRCLPVLGTGRSES
jgi:hypothetical protein